MKRATPGGYGGKPPGVAIIGVPTGARNAGSGAPTGDQSTDMNGTRPTPCVCQDLKTTKSLDAILATRLPSPRLASALISSARDRRFLQCRELIAFGRKHSAFIGCWANSAEIQKRNERCPAAKEQQRTPAGVSAG